MIRDNLKINEFGKRLVDQTRAREKKALERSDRQISTSAELDRQKQVRLPLCGKETKNIPNGMLRSGLFSLYRHELRAHLESEKIASINGVDIQYTGKAMNQEDLTVYASLISQLAKNNTGETFSTSLYKILTDIGKRNSGKNRKDLIDTMMRLRGAAIKISQGEQRYIGGLIDRANINEITGRWEITIDTKIAVLFRDDQYTRIHWNLRLGLRKKPLAMWLHGFFSSHKKPYPIRASTIQKLCMSSSSERNFRNLTLPRALSEISRVSRELGKEFEWEIEGGLVRILKNFEDLPDEKI